MYNYCLMTLEQQIGFLESDIKKLFKELTNINYGKHQY